MNMQVQVLFHYLTCFQFSWIYTRGEIVGSYGISIFNFPRNCHSGFYSSYTVLCSHQQCIPVPTFPRSHQHLLFSFFKKSIVILVAVKWYLMILICISLMTHDVDHLFLGLLAICIPSLEKCLFRSFVHFKLCLFIVAFQKGFSN